ncbi:sugar ABC transporter permease, partial [Eubacteriales bacterium OttesenSCG-928-N13]|nr:sugar ABC transporter permease [Eubacteriales bacterium OttesenSCG-928-N13]
MNSWYRNHRDQVTGLLFVLPAVLYMCALMIYPLVYNFMLSFRNLTVMTFKGDTSVFVGLENYITILKDPDFVNALGHTLWFTVACIVVQFTLGMLMAVFFNEKFKLAGPVRGTILVAWMMPVA